MRQLTLSLITVLFVALIGSSQSIPAPDTVIIQPNPTPLALQVGFNQSSYAPGDKLRLTIALNQDAYVYVYNITPDGRIHLLFPNAYQPINLLRAGQHTIPDRRYSFVITPPTGLECVQVLALTAPIPLERWLPNGKLSRENPFPQLSQQPLQFKQAIQQTIISTVGPQGWTTVWSCFSITKPMAVLKILSMPSGALVYLEGRVVGETPLELELSPGRYEIKLTRPGYDDWSQRVTLQDKSQITLEAQLRPRAPIPIPPSPPAPPPVPRDDQPFEIGARPDLMLGFNGGLSREQIPSLGFDFNWSLSQRSRFWGLGVSFLLTGEAVPPYEDIGRPEDLGPTMVYREGPETEFYLKLSVGIGPLGLDVAGGFSIQQEAHVAQVFPFGQSAHPLDVVVKPNGYKREKIYLTGLIGFSLRSENLALSVGVHNRRGWVVGIGVLF
ncbi:MAG: DUF4384 domain-containing protein [Candidatus Bipolaricaulota bacterium]|nr:DUF4384 domain-containing protein [Candidatus Bipolaricaulota bacterium]MCS7275322.1 DUF4384 domain-containing protein [Candidatus Bipolaricaulota bacterium]MDW8110179.1 DUF4384 domain-containing protein [Candidatus Bipolaricaulota bacterium]MDW8329211.1 DUF4384 domain-containing protein [Candidatus Bipolaricaulota bacterium]